MRPPLAQLVQGAPKRDRSSRPYNLTLMSAPQIQEANELQHRYSAAYANALEERWQASLAHADGSYGYRQPNPGEPGFNQWENNMFACMACRSLATTTEGYGDCLERAKAIYRECKRQAGVQQTP